MEDPKLLEVLADASIEDLVAHRGGNIIHSKRLLRFYHDIIMYNVHLFRDKVIMDLNCGTGILSLLLTKTGAKHVISVDANALFAFDVVKANHLEEKITVVRAHPREMEALPAPYTSVDIIVTEWAYFNPFFCEKRLKDVIHCRDKWLKKPFGGLFPDELQLFVCAFEDNRNPVDFFNYWDNAYDFSWQAIKQEAISEPKKNVRIDAGQYVTDRRLCHTFNLYTLSEADLALTTKVFKLSKKQSDGSQRSNDVYVNGLNLYHEIKFNICHVTTLLSASPRSPYGGVHYSFYIQDAIELGPLTDIDCSIKIDPVAAPDSEVKVDIEAKLNSEGSTFTTRYYYKFPNGL